MQAVVWEWDWRYRKEWGMTKLCNVLVSASALLLSSLTISISALADPTSTLNSLVVTGQDFAISSADGASFSQQFKDRNANFTDCEATAAGTFCIDNGTYIVDLSTWIPPRPETPTDPATPAENQLTECELIGFQAPKGKETTGNCSALTFADNTLYVAGIRNRNGSAIYECDIVYDVDEGFTGAGAGRVAFAAGGGVSFAAGAGREPAAAMAADVPEEFGRACCVTISDRSDSA